METAFSLIIAVFALVFAPALYKALRYHLTPEIKSWWSGPHCCCCCCCRRNKKGKKKVVPRKAPARGRARFVKPAPQDKTFASTVKAPSHSNPARASVFTVGRSDLREKRLEAAARRFGAEYAEDIVRANEATGANFGDVRDAERLARKVARRTANERGVQVPSKARDATTHRARHHHDRLARMDAVGREKQRRAQEKDEAALFFARTKPPPERPPTRPDADTAQAAMFASQQFMQVRGAVDAGLTTTHEQDAIAAANYFVPVERV